MYNVLHNMTYMDHYPRDYIQFHNYYQLPHKNNQFYELHSKHYRYAKTIDRVFYDTIFVVHVFFSNFEFPMNLEHDLLSSTYNYFPDILQSKYPSLCGFDHIPLLREQVYIV